MNQILALAEHRKGSLRDISLETLTAARTLCADDTESVVLFGNGVGDLAELKRSTLVRVVGALVSLAMSRRVVTPVCRSVPMPACMAMIFAWTSLLFTIAGRRLGVTAVNLLRLPGAGAADRRLHGARLRGSRRPGGAVGGVGDHQGRT